MKAAAVLLCGLLLIGAAWGGSDQGRAHESRMIAKRFSDALDALYPDNQGKGQGVRIRCC